MVRLIVPLILFGGAALLVATSGVHAAFSRPPATTLVIDTSGNEPFEEGAWFENGYNVPNIGPIRFREFYERHREFLGEPVGPFTGTAQPFRYAALTFTGSNPPDWQVQLNNAGELDLLLAGYLPKPSSSPHPAVRDYLLALLERGIEVPRLIGPIISEPICTAPRVGGLKSCVQWTMKARFEFAESALTGHEVQRMPIGLWQTHPKFRPGATMESESTRTFFSPSLLLAGMLGLAGLLLLFRRRRVSIGGAPL